METTTKRRLGAIAGGIALACVAGVALAAWLSSGAGTAEGTSTTAVNSTISPSGGGAGLYPGATVDTTVTVNNPNQYPVVVASISPGTSDATAGNCPAGTVTTGGLTNPPGRIDPGGTRTYTLPAKMINDPSNSCQGKTFVLPLTASLASAAG
ncbi:hypothetical protein [Actinomycetospora sp. CA-053990]|uniref:hypothetical protein n=1 Tax=Actinomycetospora sp. CA-053990 TaxID=3239891 RepID=UPI003D91E36C